MEATDLNEWYRLSALLKEVKAAEMELRKKIFSYCFTTPCEGTNKLEEEAAASLGIVGGYVLKGTYNINRKVDEAVAKSLAPEFRSRNINVDALIRWKPDLAIALYRELTQEQRVFFDQCLIISPGSPELEIVMPKRKSK